MDYCYELKICFIPVVDLIELYLRVLIHYVENINNFFLRNLLGEITKVKYGKVTK